MEAKALNQEHEGRLREIKLRMKEFSNLSLNKKLKIT